MVSDFVDKALEQLQLLSRNEEYRSDPVLWAKEVLGMHLWSKQQEVSKALLENKKVGVLSCHGSGKDTSPETPILTSLGWVRADELQLGDTVFDEAGLPTKITGVSPVWDTEGYRITFDDNSTIDVSAQHLWNVQDLTQRKRGVTDWRDYWNNTVTLETQELYKLGIKTTSNQNRWRIPLTKPLRGVPTELPIDPYLLGFWLGDGNSDAHIITIGKTKLGLLDYLDSQGISYEVTNHLESKGSLRVRLAMSGLRANLRSLGLLGNKHIPVEYLLASETQRRELLAGIMDADGFTNPDKGGAVGIDLTDKRLSEDLYSLVCSLGYKVFLREGTSAYTLNGERHVTGTRYRMSWTPDTNPFKIRNQDWSVAGLAQRSRHTVRTIVSIEPIGRIQNFCIEVDSPRSLYLAGRQLVPTHNSHLAATLIMWWVCTRQQMDSIALVSAPTYNQLHAIIFESLRKNHQKFNLPGTISLKDEWKSDDGTIMAFGRKPSDQNVHGFQGIHRTGGVLVVLDEACGIHENIFVGAEAVTTGRLDHILAIFNPDDVNSYIGKAWQRQDPSWHFVNISAFDTPNFTGEYMPDEARNGLVSPEWVEEKKKSWGEDSPRYKSKVLGEFSLATTNSLFSPADMLKGSITELEPSAESVPRFGVDIARFGEDNTTVYSYQDGVVRLVDNWAKSDLVSTAERIHRLAMEHGVKEIRIDGVGVGAGVQDMLTRLGEGLYVTIGMVGNASSPDLDKWRNARAYWYDSTRERMHKGFLDIDGEDSVLADELAMITYHFKNQRNSLQIDSKEDIKLRTDKSPDFADAFIYACAELDFDPQDPINHFAPGEELEWAIEQLFPDMLSGYSPF